MEAGDDHDMTAEPLLVLIGPAATGKTTLGRGVAAALGCSFVDLDVVGDSYYAEVGWSIARVVERVGIVGRLAAEREWEHARAHAVQRVIEDHPRTVIALGAGHTSFTNRDHAARARVALGRCPSVHMVLPSSDRDEALAVLRKRAISSKGTDWTVDGHDFLAEWLDDRVSHAMATRTVYTAGETPQQSIAAITSLVEGRKGISARADL
ncbi:shikimate kinase [Streptomyces sp. TR02-1]|uniref:shikimate kinase n=1 Tax=Streptomyces sp. TR02-1 TaxID=3385977 RepID=UPI00399F34BB